MAKIVLHPQHPERVCWGCEKFCPANALRCGNGTVRTQHPAELFGDDWLEWAEESERAQAGEDPTREQTESATSASGPDGQAE